MTNPVAPVAVSFGLALLAVSGGSARAQEPKGTPPALCEVSDDPSYGYTKEQPVRVGGSPMYGAARERRFLDALRGPAGEAVRYKRLGSFSGADETILDGYEVNYDGLEKPVRLFLDWYHYDPQRAPRGFTCGQPFNLGPPPPSPFQESDDIAALALLQGAQRDFDPIPLDTDGSSNHGAMYDRFRMLARAARTAAREGKTLDLKHPPADLVDRLVILARPAACEDRAIQATAIDIVAGNGAPVPRANMVQTTNVKRLLPGVDTPEGSLAAIFPLATPRPGDSIRLTYAEGCGAAGNVVVLPIAFTPARALAAPAAALPAAATANGPVYLQAVVDLEGSLKQPSYVGGPPALTALAIETIGRWKSEPARINGAGVPIGVMLQVRFLK